MNPNQMTVEALRQTAAEIMEWANSPQNTGPFQQEAFLSYVYLSGTLERLANNLEGAMLAGTGA